MIRYSQSYATTKIKLKKNFKSKKLWVKKSKQYGYSTNFSSTIHIPDTFLKLNEIF